MHRDRHLFVVQVNAMPAASSQQVGVTACFCIFPYSTTILETLSDCA
jgi:hypothetical protein